MKCFKHSSTDAMAVCAYCGRALCADCVSESSVSRVACSPECRLALERNERALHLLISKSAQNARASAFYCYLTAGLSAAASIGAWFMLPSPFLIYFTAGCAVVLVAAGIWYGRAGRKHGLDS